MHIHSFIHAHKLQMPGNYPKESLQHTEHGESLKSRIKKHYFFLDYKKIIKYYFFQN